MIHTFQSTTFRDKDTGLYNEAYFMEVFYREWHRMLRSQQALSLLLVRSNINITDQQNLEAYIQVAKILEQCTMRSSDLISRYHENKFLIGLFELSEEGTKAVVERIFRELQQSQDLSSQRSLKALISGVYIHPRHDLDIDKVINETVQLATGLDLKNDNSNYHLKVYEFH